MVLVIGTLAKSGGVGYPARPHRDTAEPRVQRREFRVEDRRRNDSRLSTLDGIGRGIGVPERRFRQAVEYAISFSARSRMSSAATSHGARRVPWR